MKKVTLPSERLETIESLRKENFDLVTRVLELTTALISVHEIIKRSIKDGDNNA